MIMADLFKWVLGILAFLITLAGHWVLFEALFAGVVKRASLCYGNHPVRTALLGLLVTVPVAAVGVGLIGAPGAPGKFLGFAVLTALVTLSLLGSAGLARLVGERLPAPSDAGQPWRPVLRGGTVLAVCFVLPMVGWFLVLPFTLVSGVGAAVLSLRSPRAAASAAET
jgi:hypothetical protein